MISSDRANIERDQAFTQMRDLLDGALSGRGGAVVISGLPGMGKTELLHAFTEQAAQAGALTLVALASRDEKTLPLAVIGQLLSSADLPNEKCGHISSLFHYVSAAHQGREAQLNPTEAPALHELCQILLGLANDVPLVIAVDDVQDADSSSLLCLAYLMRRLRLARILILLTTDVPLFESSSLLAGDFARNPYCVSIELEPLSSDGIATMVEAELPEAASVDLAEQIHALSGGNPLLAGALIDDYRSSGEKTLAGDAYAQAVARCLLQREPQLQQMARVLAVVIGDEPLTSQQLANLLLLDPEVSDRALRVLARMGLLADGRFRHDRARATIVAQTSATERAQIHRRTANLLHACGAAAEVIAEHVLQAGPFGEPWIPTVLLDAAAQALSAGQTQKAIQHAQIAYELEAPYERHMEITAMLARAKWRLSPLGVLPYLPEMVAAARSGRLSGREISRLTLYLAWHGKVDEAVAMLNTLTSAEDLDPQIAHELDGALLRLTYLYPNSGVRRRPDAVEADESTKPRIVLSRDHVDLVSQARQVLRTTPLDEDSLCQLSAALYLLTFGDVPPEAGVTYSHLLAQADEQGAPMWRAVLSSVRAEVTMHSKDLAGAEEYGRESLRVLTPEGWGVVVGGPLSSLIRIATCTGRYDAAAGYLDVPVPPAMFGTPFGAMYLHARGIYYLAVKRFREAVNDLQACGDLLTSWGIDVPGFIPWRSDLALAHHALGRRDEAEVMVHEELRRLDDRHPRTRGKALRALAVGREPENRLQLLREAADLLQSSGDRLEAANALADLSQALDDVGQPGRARRTWRVASSLAKQFNAEALLHRLDNDFPPDQAQGRRGGLALVQSPGLGELSDAERRVAALAARGDTNREIASKLYVTVSTVEQHLTRVYRKLNVHRRCDLAPRLAPNRPANPGGPLDDDDPEPGWREATVFDHRDLPDDPASPPVARRGGFQSRCAK